MIFSGKYFLNPNMYHLYHVKSSVITFLGWGGGVLGPKIQIALNGLKHRVRVSSGIAGQKNRKIGISSVKK